MKRTLLIVCVWLAVCGIWAEVPNELVGWIEHVNKVRSVEAKYAVISMNNIYDTDAAKEFARELDYNAVAQTALNTHATSSMSTCPIALCEYKRCDDTEDLMLRVYRVINSISTIEFRRMQGSRQTLWNVWQSPDFVVTNNPPATARGQYQSSDAYWGNMTVASSTGEISLLRAYDFFKHGQLALSHDSNGNTLLTSSFSIGAPNVAQIFAITSATQGLHYMASATLNSETKLPTVISYQTSEGFGFREMRVLEYAEVNGIYYPKVAVSTTDNMPKSRTWDCQLFVLDESSLRLSSTCSSEKLNSTVPDGTRVYDYKLKLNYVEGHPAKD